MAQSAGDTVERGCAPKQRSFSGVAIFSTDFETITGVQNYATLAAPTRKLLAIVL
jgi:hypothetical protein